MSTTFPFYYPHTVRQRLASLLWVLRGRAHSGMTLSLTFSDKLSRRVQLYK